jgi:hypothetical protein
MGHGKTLDTSKPDVMAIVSVLGARITQADDQTAAHGYTT